MKLIKVCMIVFGLFALTACPSKNDGGSGGSTKATAPGTCYNNNAQYGNYRYQWMNNICVDTQNGNVQVDPQHCQTSYYNNTNSNYYWGSNPTVNRYYYSGSSCIDSTTGQTVDPSLCQNTYNNCNGTAPGIYPGVGGGQGACAQYDTIDVKYYPVTYSTGQTYCVGYQTINQFNNYYWGYQPMYYPNGAIQGCQVGASNCNCVSAGGTIGWISGGIEAGICITPY